jgi:catechol O-methyltransferase
MEEFGTHYPMYALGGTKGALLEALVRDVAPSRALELGSFLGYSAIRTARALPPSGRLLCLEASPGNAATARALLDYSGLGERVDILVGLAAASLPEAAKRLGPTGADLVFMDHCKECYLPDARSAEALGLLRAGSVLAADNVLVPGAPDFLAYVATSAGRYDTRLLDAPFEYDQPWRQGWEKGRPDAISVSVRRPDADAQAAAMTQ